MWIHHGETVIVNDEDEEEYDDETLESLSQYSAELDARMGPEFGNEQGGPNNGGRASRGVLKPKEFRGRFRNAIGALVRDKLNPTIPN